MIARHERTTQPAARMAQITRDLRAELEAGDRAYWRDVANAVRRHGVPEVAQYVRYPAIALEPIARGAVQAAWDDAELSIQNALTRLGARVLGLRTDPGREPRRLAGGWTLIWRADDGAAGGSRARAAIAIHASDDALREARRLISLAEQLVIPPEAIERYVEGRIPPLRNVIEVARRKLCGQIIADQVGAGNGIREIIKALDEQGFGSSAGHRENIARTESTTLYNQGRVARYRSSAVVDGLRFDAIMDDRVTEVCARLNGQVFRTADVNGVTPPLHFECRSALTPVLFNEMPQSVQSADDYLRDDGTPNPMPGFGGVDVPNMPAPREPGELYRVLGESERADVRALVDELRGY